MDAQETTAPSIDELAARAQTASSQSAAAQLASADADRDASAAQREAERARLPHPRALRALISGGYRAQRDAAQERAAAAELARVGAKEWLRRAELEEGLADARVVAALNVASAAHAAAVAAAVEQVVTGGGVEAARMTEHVGRMDACAAQLVEVAETARALTSAREATRVAEKELGSAASWGTYDTWFGGGLLSSSIKHDRIDAANDAMGRVHATLASARKELADVSVEIAAPDLSEVGSNRTMDVWFDNIFSDLGTQSRIQDGQADVQQLASELAGVDRRLTDLREQLIRQQAEATAARDALVAPLLASRS
jgi:hypothetical protein